MKNKLIFPLLIVSFFLAACSTDSQQTLDLAAEENRFTNTEVVTFTLNLPHPYSAGQKTIAPEKEGDFPVIYFDFSNESEGSPLMSVIEKEKEHQKKNCSDPEKCPKVYWNDPEPDNGYQRVKYMVKHHSVNPEEEGDYMHNYHYSYALGDQLVHFWMYAPESKNPKKAAGQFTDILSTLSFDLDNTERVTFEGFGSNYVDDGKSIQVSEEDLNMTIWYGATNESVSSENLLEKEKEWQAKKCGQTDACGEFMDVEEVKVNGHDGVKYLIHYKGRNLGDTEGFIKEFHYSFLSPKGNLYQFWTGTTDLEEPEKREALFDEFMQHISFKTLKTMLH